MRRGAPCPERINRSAGRRRGSLALRAGIAHSDGERLRDAGPEHVGLFILDGLMTRELALADNVAAELLGPGDVVRPWQPRAPERLVPFGVCWSVTALSALGLRQPALGIGHGGSLPIGPAHCGPGPSQTHPERVRN